MVGLVPAARRPSRAAAVLVSLGLAPVCLAPPTPVAAAAQEDPAAMSAPVQGWVVDAEYGQPLPGVEVWVVGAEPTFTDADGLFDLGRMPGGERIVHVRGLTHVPLEQAVTFGGGHPRPRLAIQRDTVRERKLASVDTRLRLDRRRHQQFFRTIERDSLLLLSGRELQTEARSLIPYGGPCELSPNTGRCRSSDGPLLIVDDEVGGARLDQISSLNPAELYLVEFYPDRRFVHAFTVGFIARAMEQPALILRARRVPR